METLVTNVLVIFSTMQRMAPVNLVPIASLIIPGRVVLYLSHWTAVDSPCVWWVFSLQSTFLFNLGSCLFILWKIPCLMQGEKECSYYMKTGHCKFGATCKFHHPELGFLTETPGMYPPVQPPPISSSHPYPHLANWQMGRPPVVPGSFLPGSYPPMVLPHTVIPMQGWNPYVVSFYYHFVLYYFI